MKWSKYTKFRIMKPSGTHKSYRIQYNSNGRWLTYQTPTIKSINQAFHNNTSSKSHTEQKLKTILADLYRERDGNNIVFNNENVRIVEKYFAERYSSINTRSMDTDSIRSAKDDLNRAVAALGSVSLHDPIEVLDKVLYSTLSGTPLRKAIARINSILRWLGRDVKLKLPKRQLKVINFITEAQLIELIKLVDDPLAKTLYQVAFYTGMRIGEIFAIREGDIDWHNNVVYVQKQLKKSGEIDRTKTGASRIVVILPQAKKPLQTWISLDVEPARNRRWAENFRRVVRKVLRKDNIRFHDLRHSYAKFMLANGIDIGTVAMSLGNGIQVCQDYYTGRSLSPLMVEGILSKFRQ